MPDDESVRQRRVDALLPEITRLAARYSAPFAPYAMWWVRQAMESEIHTGDC